MGNISEIKKYFKESISNPKGGFINGFLSEMFSFFCILITAIILFSFLSEEQIYGLNLLVASGSWIILSLSFIGLIVVSFITERILKGFFLLLKMFISLLQFLKRL